MQVYRPTASGGVAPDGDFVEVADGSPIRAKVWMGTQAQKDVLVELDPNTIYATID